MIQITGFRIFLLILISGELHCSNIFLEESAAKNIRQINVIPKLLSSLLRLNYFCVYAHVWAYTWSEDSLQESGRTQGSGGGAFACEPPGQPIFLFKKQNKIKKTNYRSSALV